MSKDYEQHITGEGSAEMGYVLSSLKEYGGEYGPAIRLGLGTPPIGIAPELLQPLAERRSGNDLVHYPEDPLHTETSKILLEGIDIKGVGPESVVLNGNGSYGAGDEVVRFLALEGYKKMYVTNYSFPNVSQWAARHGVFYKPVVTRTLDPRESLREIQNYGNTELAGSIVYIDYPNNPFGLTEPDLLRDVIKNSAEKGAVPLVDLAFGEVLGQEYTNITQYTLDKGGITLGSITKTQGGAKLRAGWSIMPPRFTSDGYSGEQRMVFGLNDEAEFMLRILQKRNGDGLTLAQKHAIRVANYNTEANNYLYKGLTGLGLNVMPTDTKTAIQVVLSEKQDFYQRLLKVGIETESLESYKGTLNGNAGFGNSAVRMLTPGPGDIEEVLRRVEIAVS